MGKWPKITFGGLIWVHWVYFSGVLGVVKVYKSGLRILIRAPEVPFLVPPKWLKLGHFSQFAILGVQKKPLRVRQIKILRPLLKS